jgi:hypothetical protein
MFIHPDLLMAQQKQHRDDLVAQADQYRLLAAARRSRRARDGRGGHGSAEPGATVRGRPAGNLAACGPRAAAPAR